MSVLIKGLKMPKCCDECPMLYEYRFCALTDDHASCIEWKTEEKRMPNCPLIELPDHGDLIDRDKVREKAHKLPNGYNHGYFHKCVDELFDYAPVVIPAEKSEE